MRGRLRIRPTARGWQALIAGVVVLAVARLIGTTQFHQLAYALLALTLAALALGFIGSRGVSFSRVLPPGVHLTAGSPARFELRVYNGSRLAVSGVEVVDRLPGRRSFGSSPLERGDRAVVEAPVEFDRRGVYELGPAEVRTTDPFGLIRFCRTFEDREEVVVYPRVYPLHGFPLPGGMVEDGGRSAREGRSDEFAGLREYRRGDDLRHIYWKSVARTGELFVKEFAVHAPRRYTVALDLERRGLRVPEGEVEDAVSAAASVLAHLRKERLPFRLLCADGAKNATAFGTGEDDYWSAMRLLATVKADGGRDAGSVLLEKREGLGEGVIIVSRDRRGELPEAVAALRRAGLTVVVVALATHTYLGGPVPVEREERFVRGLMRLEAVGAEVRVVRHPEGVVGLSGGAAGGHERSPA